MISLKPLRLVSTLLGLFLLSSVYSSANGECWYLEMPKKNAEYLIKQCSKEDQTKYDKALASLPTFISKRTIKEIEICVRAEGNNEQEISGKRHPQKEVKIGDNLVHLTGGFYMSYQGSGLGDQFRGWGRFNLNKRMTAKEQPIFQIRTSRKIS